jgi:NitT/TauT family transport system ATP-binding protein
MLELRQVAKTYRDAEGRSLRALAPTDLVIEEGSFVALVGPSGCGKTTLLKMIAGLIPISEGSILVDGLASTLPPERMGMVFQQPAMLPWRTILKNLLLPSQITGKGREGAEGRALDLLRRVGLEGTGNKYPSELSGGMQQRVAIARSLIQNPDVLLMDEPFSALDAMTREDLGTLLEGLLVEAHKTVVFVTHSIPEAALLADRIIVLTPGPGTMVADIAVNIARPRNTHDPETAKRLSVVEAEVRQALDAGMAARSTNESEKQHVVSY